MKNKTVKRYYPLLLGLGLAVLLAGCTEKRNEEAIDPSKREKPFPVVLEGFSAELDMSGIKAMNFEMGLAQGSTSSYIPKHKLVDGAKVKVLTVLYGPMSGTFGAAELDWIYRSAYIDEHGTKHPARLFLPRSEIMTNGESMIMTHSSDWRMLAIIGGTYNPSAKTVSVIPTRELTGVRNQNPSGDRFHLEVPFCMRRNVTVVKEEDGVKFISNDMALGRAPFKPLGSVIGYQLGNSVAGTTFRPTSFTVYSDAFNDTGYFDLQNTGSDGYPKWVASNDCESTMRYTFASATPVGDISGGNLSHYRYYAWVMPTDGTTVANTKILLDGDFISGIPPTNRLRLWATNYTPNGTGRPALHKAHTLKASLSGGLDIKMPLEAVTERNLAGGRNISNFLYPLPTSPSGPWPGLDGKLRFANSHDNNASGYYNWYIVAGHEKGVTNTADALKYNPQGHNLLDMTLEGDSEPIRKKYFVPELEDWWGVFWSSNQINWTSGNSHITKDFCRIGGPISPVRFTSGASFSAPITPHGFLNNREVYALRFIKAPVGVTPHKQAWYNHRTGQYDIVTCYPVLTDNRLAMAFRYTRVGSHSSDNLTDHLKVESYFLGEAGYNSLSTKDADGVKAAWSSFPSSEITTRTFPATGYYSPNTSTPFSGARFVLYRGYRGFYWSATHYLADDGWYVYWYSYYAYSYFSHSANYGIPVRLFHK